jgi:uncharacterized protein YcaQ
VAGVRLSVAQARRIALAAQGFAEPRPAGRVDARQLRRAVDRMAVLQIDSVNVLARSHYLPVFARLGAYPRDLLDRMTNYSGTSSAPSRRRGRRPPELFEYWAHAASLLPVEHQPLLRWRMRRAHLEHWTGIRRFAQENPGLIEDTYRLVAENGPVVAGDTGIPRPPPRPGHMWNWHAGKIALEYLFYEGRVTTAKRVNFERYYDLPERVLPPSVLEAPTPDEPDAVRDLVRLAARALGVATEADLRDYYRTSSRITRPAITDLEAAGELIPVQVAGWSAPAWLWHEARRPRHVAARAVLSPFDPLVWFRDRTERLFDFHYRIEIYTPEPQRRFGYYVLPVLVGDSLAGRVDLKTDRQASMLRVQSAWLEPGQEPQHVARELAGELTELAGWLGVGAITVAGRGNLAVALSAALG